MQHPSFVGRDYEIEELLDTLIAAQQGSGTVVFIAGDAGIGKTSLVEELKILVGRNPSLSSTIFAEGASYESTGSHTAYQPFIEILNTLAQSAPKKRGYLDYIRTIIKETAPDWLQAIPIFGPILSASAKTVNIASELLTSNHAGESKLQNMARQYSEVLENIAKDQALLILAIDDAQWIDSASCEILLRLSQRIKYIKLAILVIFRPLDAKSNQPFLTTRSEINIHGYAKTLNLNGWTKKQINDYITERYKSTLHVNLMDWLHHLCNGNPFYITQYLNLLEEQKIIYSKQGNYVLDGDIIIKDEEIEVSGTLSHLIPPSNINELLEQRIERIVDDERELLEIAAVQGEYFGSIVLAEIFQKKELNILARLRHVSERHRVIDLYTGQNWLKDKSEVYIFEHFLMYQAFYRRLSPRERKLYHLEIAVVLERFSTTYPVVPRKLLVDIATHYKNGDDHLQAATYYYKVAVSSYAEGSVTETFKLSEESLRLLRLTPQNSEIRDSLIADFTLLFLMCARYGALTQTDFPNLILAANEGEQAAKRAKNIMTLSGIMALKGHLYISSGNVMLGLVSLRESVNVARSTNDKVTEFVVLSQLGSQLGKEDLVESIRIRYEAQTLYESVVAPLDLEEPLRGLTIREYNRNLVYTGLGEFDNGNYSVALDYMVRGVNALKNNQQQGDLIAALNYLGQLYVILGLFEDAEVTILESINLRTNYGKDTQHPWIGYNLSLLGKLYLEWNRIAEAADPLQEAVQISVATHQSDLITLVRCYYAEFLLLKDNSESDIHIAERTLLENLKESQVAGLDRSSANSLGLLSTLYLKKREPDKAILYSSQAIEYVKRKGNMPAVRTEELYFYHFITLDAIGRIEEALNALQQAYEIVQIKSRSITDAHIKQVYLNRVHLNATIKSHYQKRFGDELSSE